MPTVEADVVANELERTHPKLQLLFERESTFYSKVILKRPAEEISSRDFRIPLEIRPGGRLDTLILMVVVWDEAMVRNSIRLSYQPHMSRWV